MKKEDQLKQDYFTWLDKAVANSSKKSLEGIMICLYESEYYQTQLLGYEKIDRNNNDWVCNWTYEEKEIHEFASDEFANDWRKALEESRSWTLEFLESKNVGSTLFSKISLLIFGFADGDIEILLPENERGNYV